MTDKKTFWVADLGGQKALITGADARDHWAFHGWSETTEPGEDEQVFVWMTHPDVGNPAAIPWAARAYWMGIGFAPSPPAEPVNPTRDPALIDTPAVAPVAVTHAKSTAAPAAPNKEA